MDDQHIEPLLGDDTQPSWVTQQDDENNTTSTSTNNSPWDQAAANLTANNNNNNSDTWIDPSQDKKEDDLPKIVLMMRLGNLGAAGLLIFGSVSVVFHNVLQLVLYNIISSLQLMCTSCESESQLQIIGRKLDKCI